ncbi:MAG: EamA family transporter [Myxococcales bacterium]|nr:DMT family transporter [Myxococcota bacterium]MDW8281627.1 EamA family transporter [Myxococcales bacterium]
MPRPSPSLPSSRSAPWLVALGAALWGTESAFRIPLSRHLSSEVIVLYEHVVLVLMFLPWLVVPLRRGELWQIRRRTWGYLLFSGTAGSAVGAVLFTEALRRGNPTVVNVMLNLQPVLSTTFAWLLFRDRLSRGFYLWAAVAVLSGAALSLERPETFLTTLGQRGLDAGAFWALLCALCWGLSTVAGRGIMMEMRLGLAAALRVVIGLVCMIAVVALRAAGASLWPPAQHAGQVAWQLVLLATVSGGLPLLLYFQGLKGTRASTAGYFEMMQTLAAVVITWGVFGHALRPHQITAGVVLICAVALLKRAQRAVEDLPTGG